MPTYLSEIVAAHRRTAAADTRDLDELIRAALGSRPPEPFARRLAETDGLAVIAEIKRRSPSKGALAEDLDPSELASAYVAGGASCLSVLTDVAHFGGSAEDLRVARAAGGVPVLRKDFTVSPHDVADARIMGADAVLLIVAALDDAELAELHQLAGRLELDALVEVHDEAELDRALAAGARLVGVNQRDLTTFEVDGDRAARVGRAIPSEVVAVAESGITGPADARRLAEAGFEAVLVGELLVRSADPKAAVHELVGHPRSSR